MKLKFKKIEMSINENHNSNNDIKIKNDQKEVNNNTDINNKIEEIDNIPIKNNNLNFVQLLEKELSKDNKEINLLYITL